MLGWDALARSLNSLANEVDDEQAERLREEAAQVRARIAGLAPDHWIVKRERAYALWREGKWAEAIALTREIMDGGPMSYERAYPYTELIFSVGHLDETVAVVEQLKAIEPLAMFISRDLQYDYTAARRIDDAEAEYQRSLSLDGNDTEPTVLAFHRMLARPDADPKALRDLHGRLVKAYGWPFLLDLGGVLNDRDAMLAILREAAKDPAYGGGARAIVFQMETADALGDADLAVDALRRYLESAKGFADGSMHHRTYWQFWTSPHSEREGPSGVQEIADPDGGGRLLATNRPLGRRLQAGRRGRLPVRVMAAARIPRKSCGVPLCCDVALAPTLLRPPDLQVPRSPASRAPPHGETSHPPTSR